MTAKLKDRLDRLTLAVRHKAVSITVLLACFTLGATAQTPAPKAPLAAPSAAPITASSNATAKAASAAAPKGLGGTAATPSPLVRVPDGRMLAPDIARIVNRGELVVAILAQDTPPFVYEKEGDLRGVDIDLVREIGKQLKVPVRFDRTAKTYDGVVELVANGQADMAVSKLARTLKRAQTVLFSEPYMLSLIHISEPTRPY